MSNDLLIGYTQKDLLMGKIVDPAWYRLHIESIEAKLSKNQDSTNYVVTGTVVFNAEDGSKTFTGVPIIWNFNSKAIGLSRGFMEACGFEVAAEQRYNLGACIGHDIDVFVDNKLFEGRTLNNVPHRYRTPRTESV